MTTFKTSLQSIGFYDFQIDNGIFDVNWLMCAKLMHNEDLTDGLINFSYSEYISRFDNEKYCTDLLKCCQLHFSDDILKVVKYFLPSCKEVNFTKFTSYVYDDFYFDMLFNESFKDELDKFIYDNEESLNEWLIDNSHFSLSQIKFFLESTSNFELAFNKLLEYMFFVYDDDILLRDVTENIPEKFELFYLDYFKGEF